MYEDMIVRIDLPFRCPHGSTLYVQDVLGVMVYRHVEDDKACLYLNRFDSSSDAILKQQAKQAHYEVVPEVLAALSASHGARLEFYILLSKARGTETALLLQRMVDIFERLTEPRRLYEEAIRQFGPTMVANLRLLTGREYANLLPTVETGKKPSYAYLDSLQQSQLQALESHVQRAQRDQHLRLDDTVRTIRTRGAQ